ncbi:MAG: hypothetical protein DWQ31_14535 [Planctomycetota bacterium]|nr:MAG: hypothetical protein DWQ31_14535 [Planctomycetota bacterium]REJ90400.1 MAG: hypothetical protein DWQ35_16365 [Planctomycetota bacterium]REK24774.1 MAG: hypothetical protein DWQ42_12945 [Planctomycetota bacterium]REK42510.1 MAG: hypothetical protein DWQ46_12895 [Planctomycetota bacterium]
MQVQLWDVGAANVAPPRVTPPASGKYWRSDDGLWVAHFQPHGMTLLDVAGGRVVGWVAGADRILPWERAKPLLAELTVWLMSQGVVGTHGGFVGRDGEGVLLVGKGGSGKTTTALCCLDAGFEFLGDDHVELEERAAGEFICHGLYASTALWPEHAKRFPRLSTSQMQDVPQTDRPKPCFLLPPQVAAALARPSRVRAVVVPQVDGQEVTTFEPISRLPALLAMAPHSLIARFPIAARDGLDFMGRVVERVPCFRLNLGSDLAQIPAVMSQLLDRVRK